MASTKKKTQAKTRLSPVKLGSKVEISPVLAIVIVVVMIAVGYLLVSLTFAAGPGATQNPSSKKPVVHNTCYGTTGLRYVAFSDQPGGVWCKMGSTANPPASKS